MGRTEHRFWRATMESGLPRRETRACRYDVYLPDPIATHQFLFEGDVAADISDAEAAIRRFSDAAPALADTEGIARLLLRTEAVASSRIEGVVMGSGRLLRAEAAVEEGDNANDATATEILANISAMRMAIGLAEVRHQITVDDVRAIHHELLIDTEMAQHAGRLRSEQNWVGGNRFNPCAAAYVPPPPEAVPALLEDLCRFMSDDALPPLAQAAITHAQFETIHPFADGNGRTGRALIHIVLRRRGLTAGATVPISLVLATWADRYVAGLNLFRFDGELETPAGREAVNQFVALFAVASLRAVQEASAYQDRINALEEQWRGRLGTVRKGSTVERLLRMLPGAPVLTVNAAARALDRSFPATNNAVAHLAATGILSPVRLGRRNRAFEARELISLFTDFERRLASPDGDTSVSPPSRGAPARLPPGRP